MTWDALLFLGALPAVVADVLPRALPNSPSGNYAPAIVDCPTDRPTARAAAALSTSESDWVSLRRNVTFDPLVAFLEAAAIADFDASSYIGGVSQANVPNIAIAISGGGYRALMNGAGMLAAADSRTSDQPANGSISGLLQASTYLAGLSGGGWLVGSMYANNYSTIEDLRNGYTGSDLWRFDNSIFSGPSDDAQDYGNSSANSKRDVEDPELVRRLQIIDTAEYWTDVAEQVATKADAGFETSLTDYWGRALSYQLINAEYGGLAYTFSSIADMDDFVSAQAPFPILVADGRAPNTTIVSLNATVFEFNAFEMGSWDPTTYGFVPTEYLGSNFSDGAVPTTGNDTNCVRGFDQFGFVMGTSSTLFNQFLLTNLSSELGDVPSFVMSVIEDILADLGEDNNDIAQYVPNPFYGYHASSNNFASDDQLTLVDGGEDLQNIPLHPLIQPLRAVDVIVAVDSSADTDYNWPNGTALRASYERSLGDIGNGTLFPPVPDANTFINLGLNQRPTFFGCNASNFTLTGDQSVPPLIVYVPNAPYTFSSNVSTFTASYTLADRNAIIENGFNSATQGNGTVDANWPVCLACAVLSRSFDRTSTTVPTACSDCFTKYCWDGTINSTDYGAYEPAYIISNETAEATSAAAPLASGLSARALTVASSVSLLAFLFL